MSAHQLIHVDHHPAQGLLMKNSYHHRALTLIAAAALMLCQSAQAQTESSVLTEKSVPIDKAEASSSAIFRPFAAPNVSSINSHLTVSSDEGLWRSSFGLPVGSKVLMAVSSVNVPADGVSSTRIKVSVFDKDGKPLSEKTGRIKLLLETNLGRFQVPGLASSDDISFPHGNPNAGNPLTSPTGQPTTELRALEVLLKNGEAQFTLMAPATPGTALVRASSGAIGVQGEVNFSPDLRPLMVVGLIEGTVSGSKIKKDANAPEINNTFFEESLRHWTKTNTNTSSNTERTMAGRLAFFTKGAIKGEYLLTAAADSDKLTKEQLFRDIDPNAFYPIYGDASVKQFDAQSKSRIFVRVDHQKSYALYGDFQTNTESNNSLAAYNRSLTGAKWHLENQTVKLNAYAAKDTLRAYVDEQPGLGISGPYGVGKPNAVANSEQVSVLVRDRTQPGVVLKSTPLNRFVDYDFEPFSGRILFRQPIPSVDENLNPVSIRVAYEVEEGGEKFWVGGVDGNVKLGERFQVGASHAEDQNPTAPYKLSGLHGEMKLGQNTFIKAELAQSHGTQYYNQGLTNSILGAATPSGLDQTGRAGRLEARHDGEKLTARAALARSGATFQNSNAGLNAGRQELSARADYRLTPKVTVWSELTESQDNSVANSPTRGSKRDAASLGGSVDLTSMFKADLSLHHARQHVAGGASGLLAPVTPVNSDNANNASFGFNGTGLLSGGTTTSGLSPTIASKVLSDDSYTSVRGRLTAKLTERASVYGEHEEASGSKRRSALGGEYRITDKTRFYGKHELASSLASGYGLGSDVKVSSTAVGLDTAYMKDGQIFSEYRIAGTQEGRDSAAALGVRNLWTLKDGLQATTSVERQQLKDAQGQSHQATVLALGAEYLANPLYRLGGKLELRHSDTQNQLLSTLAVNRKLSDNWAALARNLYMKTSSRGSAVLGGDQTQDRFQVGLAYRDSQTNIFHGLARLEYRIDQNTAQAAPVDTTATIASLHGNYHRTRPWTWAGQVAVKRVNETLGANAIDSQWTGALLAGRVIWDFAERFDLSVYASGQKGGSTQLAGLGAELGYRVIDNLWVSGGFTYGRYSDVELFSSNTSRTGWHLRLRYTFDEKALSWRDPRVNRTLDKAADGADKSPRQWRE
jgi:hypothetical protein